MSIQGRWHDLWIDSLNWSETVYVLSVASAKKCVEPRSTDLTKYEGHDYSGTDNALGRLYFSYSIFYKIHIGLMALKGRWALFIQWKAGKNYGIELDTFRREWFPASLWAVALLATCLLLSTRQSFKMDGSLPRNKQWSLRHFWGASLVWKWHRSAGGTWVCSKKTHPNST